MNDINPHIIELYRMIYDGRLSPDEVRKYLLSEGAKLDSHGEDYYYVVRERFNKSGAPLDFLFLNRACFNGMIRFNAKGEFNVPFCRRTNRFQQAYVSKIVNQIARIRQIMHGKDWEFRVGDWQIVLQNVSSSDFVYLDPPYIGRHADYYQKWTDADATALANAAFNLPCGFALSLWKRNKYRVNQHVPRYWAGLIERSASHFYHVGATQNLRNAIKPGYETAQSHIS